MQPPEIKDEAGKVIGGLYETAQRMANREDFGGMIRNAGQIVITALEKGKGVESDALGMVQRGTSWLDEPVIAETLSHSSFHLSDLKNGKLSVFLVLPPEEIKHYSGFLRLFVKNSLLAMERSVEPEDGKDEKPPDRKCLFLLDEFYSLGKLDEILTAAGLMPGYGVHLWPFVQNLGQLDLLYGEHGRNTILNTVDASIFFHLKDDAVAVSEKIGALTPDDIGVTPPVMVAFNKYKDRNYLWDDERTAREKHSAAFANAQASYQHAMRMVGTPRIPPDMVREIVAARKVDEVARSMIVFAKGSDVLNLALYPHFATIKPRLQPSAYSPVKAKPEKNGIFDLAKRGMSWVFGAR
ncbi:Type IV secretion system protein TraG/VirD4 [Rhabdaerophilaceae bacterium]